MVYTILNILGVLFLLAFMAASLAIWCKLLINHQELMKKPEDERLGSFMKMVWDTLRMK